MSVVNSPAQAAMIKGFRLKVVKISNRAGVTKKTLIPNGFGVIGADESERFTPSNKYAMRGYQCDIDGQNRYTGNNYEEKGRLFLGVRGQMSRITGTAVPSILSTFGDMKELGPLSQREHVKIGEQAVRLGIDLLVGAGPEMAHATSAAARLSAGRLAPHPTRVAHVISPLDAVPIVRSLWRSGDVVYVKGSRSMAMELVLDALCAGGQA